MRKINVLILSVLFAVGCDSSKSSDLMPPQKTYSKDSVSGGQISFSFNPKVDILFVIDNSDSMKEEQDKLIKATELFVDSFGENNFIDFQVGIISVFDSRRCGQPDKNGVVLECYPEGKLQKPLVVRGEGAKKQLSDSLNIGTIPYEQGGPRFEELFSPILKALSPDMNIANGGLVRPDSRVVVIMITDEDDSSSVLSVDDFLYKLDETVGLERTDLYGVVAVDGCPRNSYADAPDRIITAVQQLGRGKIFPICDSKFGSYLASIGKDIRKQLLKHEIVLPSIPEAGTLELLYGGKTILPSQGWTYDPRTLKISFLPKIAAIYQPNSTFTVNYIKVEK